MDKIKLFEVVIRGEGYPNGAGVYIVEAESLKEAVDYMSTFSGNVVAVAPINALEYIKVPKKEE